MKITYDGDFIKESREVWGDIVKDCSDEELEEILDNYLALLNFVLEEATESKTKEVDNV